MVVLAFWWSKCFEHVKLSNWGQTTDLSCSKCSDCQWELKRRPETWHHLIGGVRDWTWKLPHADHVLYHWATFLSLMPQHLIFPSFTSPKATVFIWMLKLPFVKNNHINHFSRERYTDVHVYSLMAVIWTYLHIGMCSHQHYTTLIAPYATSKAVQFNVIKCGGVNDQARCTQKMIINNFL